MKTWRKFIDYEAIKRLLTLWLRLCAVLGVTLLFIFATSASASAQSSVSSIFVGSRGSDWAIGTWTCRNGMPSQLGGPAVTKFLASRSDSLPPDIFIRFTGRRFDATAFLHYDVKTQTWWNPSSVASGVTANESSRQTGKTTVWNGIATDASGTSPVRDTYVHMDMRTFTDTTEIQSGGAWKTVGRLKCTKS